MSNFHRVWDAVGGKARKASTWKHLRKELLYGCFGAALLHTSMTSRVSQDMTSSDASLWGGAIAISRELTESGKTLVAARPRRVPVVLVSLFNGIGVAARCYDVAGVSLVGRLFCDVHGPANRVSSRRWPDAVLWPDICTLTKEVLEEKLLQIGRI